MSPIPKDMEALLSGYLDGQLSAEDKTRVETFLAESEEGRHELDQLRQLVEAASQLTVKPPPDEVWDTFLDNVYNRIERKTGWYIFIFGAAFLTAFGIYHFIVDPWAGVLQKTAVAIPVAGLAVLFLSVLRQRRSVAKTDRYSREVKR